MLLARNQPGDHAKAMTLLEAALATARELGMHALETHILDQSPEQRSLALATPAAPVILTDLSQREVEVLRLLALGKSNRDIADVLCISLNTVATHVRNILAKTGTANRTEAAAYALRHGLGVE
jgi:DNA-binding NarL/FixJ family response regulator